MARTSFVTTTVGLNRDCPPMLLFEKAKRLGIWNPSDIDFSVDARDWPTMLENERDAVLRLTALFQSGEEAVTLDLLPLIMAVAEQGRVEEEMFLTTFLWEEAKHVDFFSRFLELVAKDTTDLHRYHDDNYRFIFYEALPTALNQLRNDTSPIALARAVTTYNLVVEGIIAETGYHAYFTALDLRKILPGTRKGVSLIKQDEARHIAYGIYLLSRLIAEDPSLWNVVQDTMNELLMPTLGIIEETFGRYEVPPFEVDKEFFSTYAMQQFQKRLDRIDRARRMSMSELNAATFAIISEDDA